MEPTQTGEEQAKEREKLPPADGGSGSTTETVAPSESTEIGKSSTEMKKTAEQIPPEDDLPDGMPSLEKALQAMEEDSAEETFVIESSPEKQPSEKTKEDSLKSPGEEVFSIDDEEEAEERPVAEEEEDEEEEEEEEEDEEEEFEEMDEDEEIYVETTDRVDANELSDENSSEPVISSDEYTDEEVDRVPAGSRKGEKSMPAPDNRRACTEQDNDDGDVQILTDDDEVEEEEDNEPDEEDEEEDEDDDDDEDLDGTPEQEMIVIRKFGLKYDSDSSESLVEKCPKLKVKYRNYQHKLAGVLRKRSFKILNKRSMHVMEDSSDALVVCSDVNLTTNLKQALVSPKEDAESLSVAKPPLENAETIVQTTSITTTTTTDGSQSKTKELDSVAKAQEGDRKGEHDTEGELSRNAISSTSDKMPTATAVEVVSEKIADSSDDALSVLSSKKSISAATTPSVNSSASAEPGDGKAKESNKADTTLEVVASKEGSETEKDDEHHGKVAVAQEEAGKSPTAAQENEPTVDDVMEGIDEFMDHNGSELKEQNGLDVGDFNEDLAFQMDVDEPAGTGKETVTEKSPVEEVKSDKPSDEGKRSEESAMDLTSTSEPQPSKQDQPVAEKETESAANATTTTTTASAVPVIDVVDSSPEKCNQRRASLATKEGDLNIRDKNIITSTPIATGSEKRTESVQPSTSQEEQVTQVKQEVPDVAGGVVSDETDERDEVQNLSTSKAPSAQSDEPAGPVQSTSRKRRRSVDQDGPESVAQPEEPIEPAKKLKLEVEANYQVHERVVNEYIEATPNTSVDEIQSHTDTLVKEIQTLSAMIRDTEQKWNNLLHMKKVKEEILLRLNRRKHVMDITETRLGEVSAFNHLDSSNLSSQHQLNPHQQRSSSVGPRPPTPPPEVEIRPASVSTTTNYSHNASNGVNAAGGKHSQISNRRNSSIAAGSGHRSTTNSLSNNTSGKRSASARDTNSFVSQFNSSNNAVTMVPLPNAANQIVQARANMNAADMAKEKALAMQVQRQLFPKPVLSNQQQILSNLAMSAGLTSLAAAGSGAGANNGSNTSATTVGFRDLHTLQAQLQAAFQANNNLLAGITSQALLNGHHGPSVSSAGGTSREQQQQQQEQQLQIGRQGNRKFVTSIIDEFRQQHPHSVPRRGRRMKHVGGSGSNNGGMSSTSTGNSIGGSFGERSAISLTALPGGKSPAMGSAARSGSTDSAANRISELLAAAENSRPSSNDSSQSNSNFLSSLVSASGAAASSSSQQQFLKDVLVQFAKMSQNEQSLLSNLQLLANNAVLASTGPSTATTNTVSSPQQSPQFQQQQQQQQQQTLPQLHASLLSKASLPEVTLHPVMNSTAHSDILGSHNSTNPLTGANLSAVNTSTNSLLHGILTKSASRPASGAATAAANFNSFSPTLARLLTGPERMNATQSASSSTVTSGALANLQTGGVIGGLNLSKNNSEISITPVVGSNFQQTLLAQQQQQQQQLQRLREQHLFKGESYLNIDDEADDSVDRLVIDEGDDMGSHRDVISKRRVAEINENEVPQCQGCKKMEAKFVCAGCNHQWYCSRECQVNAWDDHSEVCSG